jgi:hypothetical protein
MIHATPTIALFLSVLGTIQALRRQAFQGPDCATLSPALRARVPPFPVKESSPNPQQPSSSPPQQGRPAGEQASVASVATPDRADGTAQFRVDSSAKFVIS